MQHYKLRVTITHCTYDSVKKLLQTDCASWALVEEKGKIGELPHVHAYMLCNKKENTVRTHLRSLTTSCKGNKLYSLTKLEFDPDLGEYFACEYLAYMEKEGTVEYYNFSPEWIKQAIAHDLTVKEGIKEKKRKKLSRYKRITLDWEKFSSENKISSHCLKSSIIDFTIDFLNNEGGNISLNTIISWCNTLLLKYDPSYKAVVRSRVYSALDLPPYLTTAESKRKDALLFGHLRDAEIARVRKANDWPEDQKLN